MNCSRLVHVSILLFLDLLVPLACNATWIDKEGNPVESLVQHLTEPKSSDGMILFGPVFPSMNSQKVNRHQGKYGYKNDAGKVIISAKFAEAGRFHDGLAPVFFKDNWLYIDKTGKRKIKLPIGCSFAGVFSEGLAAIVLRSGSKSDDRFPKRVPRRGDRLGYIDPEGHLVIPAKYRFVFARDARFSNGLAAVVPGDAVLLNYGYINHDGQWAIKPKFSKAGPFQGGKASVIIGENEFSSSSWKMSHGGSDEVGMGVMRERQFQLFLSSHHLLGMTKETVESLLGPPNYLTAKTTTYCLESNCTTVLNVEINYLDDIATKYRYNSGKVNGDWIDGIRPDYSEMSEYFI
jgi:hypothetical protein